VPKALAEKYGPVAPVWAPRRSTRPHAAARTACQRATGRARAVNHDALAPFGRPPRARAVNRVTPLPLRPAGCCSWALPKIQEQRAVPLFVSQFGLLIQINGLYLPR
jgi:hypothetical protein